jgi:hypothetical protein
MVGIKYEDPNSFVQRVDFKWNIIFGKSESRIFYVAPEVIFCFLPRLCSNSVKTYLNTQDGRGNVLTFYYEEHHLHKGGRERGGE